MKNFMLFVCLLLAQSAFALDGYIKESDVGKSSGVTIYYKGNCEQRTGEKCVLFKGDMSVQEMQDVQVDDVDKPLFGPKLKSQQEADLPACQAAMAGHCDDQAPGYPVRAVCSPSGELYCIAVNPQSYEKKMERMPVVDSAKKAAKDAAKAAKDAKKVQDDALRTSCASMDPASAKLDEVAACVKLIYSK